MKRILVFSLIFLGNEDLLGNSPDEAWLVSYLFNTNMVQIGEEILRNQPTNKNPHLLYILGTHWSLQSSKKLRQDIKEQSILKSVSHLIQQESLNKESIWYKYTKANTFLQKSQIISKLFENRKLGESFLGLTTKISDIISLCSKKPMCFAEIQNSLPRLHLNPTLSSLKKALTLAKSRNYPGALQELLPLRHLPEFRLLYFIQQLNFNINQRGNGKVAIQTP